MIISTALSGTKDFKFISEKQFNVDEWTSVTISQRHAADGSYYFDFGVNGTSEYSKVNTDVREFSNVKVYASDPWYPAQDGFIKNLVITNDNKGKL